jgi:hypothetical protein
MMNKLNAGVIPADVVNPLLLNYTPKTKIQEEDVPFVPFYDDDKQIVYDTRTVGTKCLKQVSTVVRRSDGGKTTKGDKKNEIDDSKNVT